MKHRAAFVGVGHSRIMRHDDVPLGVLASEACQAAVNDAGLDMSQIDGIACVPDQPFETDAATFDGVNFVTTNFLIGALHLQTRWGHNDDRMLSHSLVEAVTAVEAGICNYALVFRALNSPKGRYGHTSSETASGLSQFRAPYGIFPPANSAQLWQRYQDKYRSGTREQMATFVVQERANGLLWENGYWTQYRPELLTVEDYLSARMVCSPFCLYDCDLPVQGCGAFVITTAERAADLAHPPVHVLGVAAPSFANPQSIQAINLEYQQQCGKKVASDLWENSGLRPNDVNVANLYDGFSILSMLWLESLGFCGEGEAFEFIQHGRIAPDGDLPLNPGGGNLGAGRLHGVNHMMESILQVQGRSGPRQLPNTDVVLAAIGPQWVGAALAVGRNPQ